MYFAYHFAASGGQLRLQNYLAMPHLFQIFQKHVSAVTVFREYGLFIRDVTKGRRIGTEMRNVSGKGIIEETPLDLEQYPVLFSKQEVLFRNVDLTQVA